MRHTLLVAAIAALTATSCAAAARETFVPRGGYVALSPAGYPAAEYDLTHCGREVAETKLWSRGAYRGVVRGREKTVVHVGLEIENETGRPITVDPRSLQLDPITTDRWVLRGLQPIATAGRTRVPPGRTQVIHVYYALPPDISPLEIDAFRVRWALRAGRVTYRHATPFAETPMTGYGPASFIPYEQLPM